MTTDATRNTPASAEPGGHGCGCGGACGGDARETAPARGDLGLVAVEATGPQSPTARPAAPAAAPGDLDARTLAPAIRRDTLVAAVLNLTPGEQLVIASDHDPARLHGVLTEQLDGPPDWTYLQAGPELWRVQVGPGAH